MKKFLLLFLISFILIGCGGGSSDSTTKTTTSSKNSSAGSISGSSFDTWSYIIPNKTSPESTSISSRSIDGTTYNATFRSIKENNIIEEIPENTDDERIIYEKNNQTIKVKFYKNDKITYQYNMKRYITIGEQTISQSSCMLVNHFDTKSFQSKTYKDVIEIDCGQHKGYYAKGKGQVYQE